MFIKLLLSTFSKYTKILCFQRHLQYIYIEALFYDTLKIQPYIAVTLV